MAMQRAVRWRPDVNLSAQQTTVQGLDTSVAPPSGSVVRIAQLIAFDDAELNKDTAVPGRLDDEVKITVLYQEPITLELAVVGQAASNAEAKALWDAALQQFAQKVQQNNADRALTRAIVPAQRSKPILL